MNAALKAGDNGDPAGTPAATEGVTTSPAEASPAAGAVAGVVPMAQGGASHDGVMPGPAPSGTPRLAWQTDTGGELYAAPSLTDGLLFVSSKNGQILAVSASTGEIAWSSELSTYVTRGTPAIADCVVFAGGGFDFRAFDAATGNVLWQTSLPASGNATPMTYVWQGRQYVVIANGGYGNFDSKMGDYVTAFALPQSR